MSVYINLYHGRPSVEQAMEDWGPYSVWFECEFMTVDYNPTTNGLRLVNVVGGDGENWLRYLEDLIYYDGIFYGAFSVHSKLPPPTDHISGFSIDAARIPLGHSLLTFDYKVVDDEGKELNSSQATVIANDQKNAVPLLRNWVEHHDGAADYRIDYGISCQLVASRKIERRKKETK